MQDNFARRGIGKRLKAIFEEIDGKKDGKIDVLELSSFLSFREYPHKPEEAETMIWEADEDHDGKLSWEEFEKSYHRCVNDGLTMREPRQLHNIVLFALHAGLKAKAMRIEDLSNYVYLEYGSVSPVFVCTRVCNCELSPLFPGNPFVNSLQEAMAKKLETIFGIKTNTTNDTITLHKFIKCLKIYQSTN